jgi:hypothetical protein
MFHWVWRELRRRRLEVHQQSRQIVPSILVGARSSANRPPPWAGADVAELNDLFEKALARVTNEQDREERELIGKMLQEQAQRAWDGSRTSRRAHYYWKVVNWILGGASATASAVGGSVLVAGQLTGPSRWIVGIASLGAGVASGLIAILQPGEEWSGARLRAKRYEDLWRSNWDYAIISLPTADLVAARSEVSKRRRELLDIMMISDVAGMGTGLKPQQTDAAPTP